MESVHDDPVSSGAFAAASGLSGVDFGGVPSATWYTDLYLVSPDRPETGPYGALVVEGVDPDGAPPPFPEQLATLHWWK